MKRETKQLNSETPKTLTTEELAVWPQRGGCMFVDCVNGREVFRWRWLGSAWMSQALTAIGFLFGFKVRL